LPFTLNSSENIDYIKQGIEEMLISRIFVPDKITVTSKNIVLEELKKSNIKGITTADVYDLGKKLNSDYVVWGSITKIGNSISIDGKLVDIVNAKSDIGIFAQSQSLDEVIPKINDFSRHGTSINRTACCHTACCRTRPCRYSPSTFGIVPRISNNCENEIRWEKRNLNICNQF
jgi:TolB-like protein